MPSNCGINRPLNDLKIEGVLDNLSYDDKKKGQFYTGQTEIKLFGLIIQDLVNILQNTALVLFCY